MYEVDVSAFLSIAKGPLHENRNISHVQHPSEVMHQEFFCPTTRSIQMLPAVDITNHVGLKAVVLRCMWQHFGENYSEKNICSWRIGCRCSNCVA